MSNQSSNSDDGKLAEGFAVNLPGGLKVPEDAIEIPVMEIRQPLGGFYVGTIPAKHLRKIAAADIRRQRTIETATGIQRPLNEKRQQEIKEYISSFDAAFPNSFIISVKSEDIIHQSTRAIYLRTGENVASIIDGQHRLSGFTDLNDDHFDLIVSIFVDLPIEDQAMLFATINLKQTKVSPSLVYDLYEETRMRSPQKTAHNVAKALNLDKDSPFYLRIKPLGTKSEFFSGVLTQAAFVKSILPLIAKDPDKIKDDIKRGIKLDVNDPVNSACIFWKHFVEEKDWAILKVINNYFAAVADVFPQDWAVATKSPLSRTIGFQALIRFLPEIYRIGLAEGTLEKEFFRQKFSNASDLAGLTFEQYPASGVGEKKIFEALRTRIVS